MFFFFCKQKTAYEWRISDWSSDVCSSDLLSGDGAAWLVHHDIELVGIDYLSIQRFNDGPEAHETLLQAGVVILEGTDLSEVAPGWYELICLLMKLQGLEGAPVRALLKERSEEHTSELQSLMRISYAVFCLTKKRYT